MTQQEVVNYWLDKSKDEVSPPTLCLMPGSTYIWALCAIKL